MLRSKASDFDYGTIPDLYCHWKKFHRTNQDGIKVTRKSIMYWVRKDNLNEYEKIKQSKLKKEQKHNTTMTKTKTIKIK